MKNENEMKISRLCNERFEPYSLNYFAETSEISMDSIAHPKAVVLRNQIDFASAEDQQYREQEYREIREFEVQDPMMKWPLKGCAFILLCTLAFLWIYYR